MKHLLKKLSCPLAILTVLFVLRTPANAAVQATVNGNQAFALDLYQQLQDKEGNVFFSPYSISSALAITYAGARGQTETEMADVLRFPLGQDRVHASFSRLQSRLNALQDKGSVQLNIANSLWAQEGSFFLEGFLDLNETYYDAGLTLVDFAAETESARQTINIWIEEETQHKIKDLIKPGVLNSLTRLVLCNAIYFKGSWLRQFNKDRTKDRDFYVAPEKTIRVPMMSQTAHVKYVDLGALSAIELPYEGEDLSMIIFLPQEKQGLDGLEDTLTNETIRQWLGRLSNTAESEVMIRLPRFKMTCAFELSKTLGGMGMPSAFSDLSADFSGMTGTRELFISRVIHQAFVDVNEEGTEAAAATVVAVNLTAVSEPRVFQADHPFLFLIRDNQTGSILFLGRVVDPTQPTEN